MAEPIRFGIVGCGVIGSFHAKVMQDVPEAKLIAVCDIVPERAQKVAEEFSCAWYTSLDDMLAQADIQAVTICTPSGMHAEHGIQAARAGKHVLSEKPLDVYIEKADALIAVCEAHGVTLGGIFQNRFPRVIRQVKKAIEDGWLGEIIFANASCLWYRGQDYFNSGTWRGTWALDGGVLSNQAIHTIDRMLFLTDMEPEVLAAYCPTLQRDIEAEDLGIALLRFPNGAGGVIQATTLAQPGEATSVTICGTKGTVVISDNSVIRFEAQGAPADLVEVTTPGGSGAASDPSALWGGAHAANIAQFAQAVQKGERPWLTGEEGRKAVSLLNEIYYMAGVGPWEEDDDDCCDCGCGCEEGHTHGE